LTQEKRIALRGVDPIDFYGAQDCNLRLLENFLDVQVIGRGHELILRGSAEELESAKRIISELIFMLNKNGSLSTDDVETIVALSAQQNAPNHDTKDIDSAILYTKKDAIRPKTASQSNYYRCARENDIVFAIGPAGTGKTFLAVAFAVASLRDKEVKKLILSRPAVEAGENLGFLPGDFREKIDPYLRPLYDALGEMVPHDKLRRFMEDRVIEIVPLAYMRGRTLDNCYVILDEAQNTTSLQMKMFLTRLGASSKAIITGDITQIDLPPRTESGLVQAQRILKGIDGIGLVYFTDKDVIRHRLVKKIIKAYERLDTNKKPEAFEKKEPSDNPESSSV
jgi:phosphate starvation-inducible PhoH-like protein